MLLQREADLYTPPVTLELERTVTFVGMENRFLSVLASVLAGHLLGDSVHVESAGVNVVAEGQSALPVVYSTLRSLDIHVNHQSTSVGSVDLMGSWLILCTMPEVKQIVERCLPGGSCGSRVEVFGGEGGMPRPSEHSGRECIRLCGWVYNQVADLAKRWDLPLRS